MKPERDLYHFDELLTEDERMVRDSVRSFVDDKFMSRIRQCYRDGTFPMDLVSEIARLGLFGATLTDYDCAGLNQIAYGLAMLELERGDSGLRSFISVQNSLVIYPINRYGTKKQQDHWLPLLARGEKIGCFGLTEADHGSDPGSMKTVAKLDGDHYVLNGAKYWITNGNVSDVGVVFAKLDGEVRGFIVETGTPGYSQNEIEGKLSLRASVTSELVFEDCRIPKDNILPDAVGLSGPLSCLNEARYGIAWGAVGAAEACFEEALDYSLERIQFNKPIARFQMVQEKLVKMWTEITKGQLMAYRLAQLKDAGKSTHYAVSAAKRNNVAMALDIARSARAVLGAAGIVDEYSVMRHMANLESVYTYEGTHDMHTLIVGEKLTGMPAYRVDGE